MAITVDVAVDTRAGKIGTRCVIRDYRGWVIALKIGVKNYSFSPTLAEAFAISGGLRLAADLGLERVVVQSDCREVVLAVKNDNILSTELGTILDDIKVRRNAFSSFSISFLPRSCNVVAHNMARYALGFTSNSRWLGLVPPCALQEVIKDQSL